jgi:hypothetical protein
MPKTSERYLERRGDNWHYVRRVPSEYSQLDQRHTIRKSLKTKSMEVACARRDALAEADDLYWASLVTSNPAMLEQHEVSLAVKKAIDRYDAANLSFNSFEAIDRFLRAFCH